MFDALMNSQERRPTKQRFLSCLGGRPAHNRVFAHFEPYAFALFRMVFGFLFLQVGTQKLFGLPNHASIEISFLLKVAGSIELTCGFLIMIGLFTEFAAILACGEMAFAYFLSHFPLSFWSIVSKGVPAVLFCFAFLFIATHGAGLWSLDKLRRNLTATGLQIGWRCVL